MSKPIIFCESYGQINYALRLIELHHDHAVTLVIPGFRDLYQFFQVINEEVFHNTVNLLYIESYQPRRAKARGIGKTPYIIPDIIRERRYLKYIFQKYFSEFYGCEVFFFSQSFSGLTFYLLKELSKRNGLVYVHLRSLFLFQPLSWTKYTPTNIADVVKLVIWKLTYGFDVSMARISLTGGFLYVSDEFINRETDRVIESTEIDEMMKGFDIGRFRVFDAGGYDVIYFDDALIETGYVSDITVFKHELARIFITLSKYFPENKIAYKYHPGYTGDRTLVNTGHMLPSFIPAELLYNEKIRLYLGVFSMSIVNIDKGLVVSLANLLTFKNKEIRNKAIGRIIQVGKSKVLIPKTLDEFERILSNLTEVS